MSGNVGARKRVTTTWPPERSMNDDFGTDPGGGNESDGQYFESVPEKSAWPFARNRQSSIRGIAGRASRSRPISSSSSSSSSLPFSFSSRSLSR